MFWGPCCLGVGLVGSSLAPSPPPISRYTDEFEAGGSLDVLASCLSEYTVCGTLKQLIRHAAKPFNSGTGGAMIAAAKSENNAIANAISVLNVMSDHCTSILYGMMHLFRLIIATKGNEMQSLNLGISIGPTLFPGVGLGEYGFLVKFMTENHDQLWSDWDTSDVDRELANGIHFFEQGRLDAQSAFREANAARAEAKRQGVPYVCFLLSFSSSLFFLSLVSTNAAVACHAAPRCTFGCGV